MKLLIKLIAVTGIVWTAILAARARRRRQDQVAPSAEAEDLLSGTEDEAILEADIVVVGIADVDPEPLMETSGEGIDRDATEAAHREISEQRERLPIRGKNIP